MARLTEVVERHALVRHEARVDRVEEVLVEGASKTDPAQRSGRTRQGKLVHFAADETTAPAGAYVDVRVTRAAPHWLQGEHVDRALHRGTSRVRIPVAAG
jgi:tRNA-2-methylthio-N6-dimethylallyladenosine synthase